MNDKFMKISVSSKLLKEAFLIFVRYNNFQLDNFHYNSEYSNFSCNLKKHWMNEYLAFQLYIQVFWKVVSWLTSIQHRGPTKFSI